MTLRSLMNEAKTWVSSKSTHSQSPSPDDDKRPYLYGIRGILALCSIVTVFVRTFVPDLVWKNDTNTNSANILRVVFTPIVWDELLISSFFLVLSCHSIALRFLNNPAPSNCSGSIIRRVFRMVLPIALASGISSGIFSAIGTGHIEHFKEVVSNDNVRTPKVTENGLVALNAIFDMFWAVRDYHSQAANALWPTETIWNLSLIFNQSWTVYFLMIILPYTRPSWHAGALSLFALGSFWVCSWGWYSAAALLLADYTTNPQLRCKLDEGLSLSKNWRWQVPYSLVGGAMATIGYAMKFTWAALPQFYHEELILHPFLHLSGKTTMTEYAAGDPYARVDNFLVIFGLLILIEKTVYVKRCLSCKLLVFLGKRSLSLFIVQSILFWTVGMMMYVHLREDRSTSPPLASFIVWVTCTSATILVAEVYHRLVDLPSQLLAKMTFTWLLC